MHCLLMNYQAKRWFLFCFVIDIFVCLYLDATCKKCVHVNRMKMCCLIKDERVDDAVLYYKKPVFIMREIVICEKVMSTCVQGTNVRYS